MLKELISKAWAEILAIRYNGKINFHHINNNGYWEFEIKNKYSDTYYYQDPVVYYKTKGLR
jgi:hypothetical protein